jgi:hypothetical protein
MYRNSIEDLYIKKIEGGIRSVTNGSKTPKDSEVAVYLNKLKPINEGMYEDLLGKYKTAVEKYKKTFE